MKIEYLIDLAKSSHLSNEYDYDYDDENRSKVFKSIKKIIFQVYSIFQIPFYLWTISGYLRQLRAISFDILTFSTFFIILLIFIPLSTHDDALKIFQIHKVSKTILILKME